MDLPKISIPLILSIIFLIVLTKICLRKNPNNSNNPPGPWKLPIIGNIHQLIGEQPHRRLQKLAKAYGPLFHLKLGEVNFIVITSSELVREIFKTHDLKFASRPALMASKIIFYNSKDVAFSPYGKYWSQLRKICTVELLSPKRVKSFGFIREEVGYNLVENIRKSAGSPVNLSEMFLVASSTIISRATFGKECKHQESLWVAMKKAFKYLSGFYMVDLFPSWSLLGEINGMRSGQERVHKEMDDLLNKIIEEHEFKNLNGDDIDNDLVDVLLRVKRNEEMDEPLTMENVKAVILDLFLAGTETTSTTLEWVMTELIRHPMAMQKAQLEVRKALNGKKIIKDEDIHKLPYINHVIKEAMRLHAIAPLLVPRLCQETTELAGYTIPVNTRVLINSWAIMRDPKFWEDPEIFRPERFEDNALDFGVTNFEFTPFGGGRRVCPGLSFGLATLESLLAQLLFHFDWRLPDGKHLEDLDVDEAFGITLTRKNGLQVLATYHD